MPPPQLIFSGNIEIRTGPEISEQNFDRSDCHGDNKVSSLK